MLTIIFVCLLSCVYFYVEATKSGLSAKYWAVGGLLIGPLLFPMFSIHRHIRLRKDCGFNNTYLRA